MGARRSDTELMDSSGILYGDLDTALQDLGVINRWLGGHRTTRIGVERLVRHYPAGTMFTVLDIGSGGTDLGDVLRPLGRDFRVTGLDINPLMREFAIRHGHTTEVVTGSAHALSYPDRSFDIVHASLFLHHCTDGEAARLIREAMRIARIGVVINDLQRNPIALMGISLLTALFARSSIVRHDAPLSVRRAFTRRELASILTHAAVDGASTSWHWAFRWCLSIAAMQGGEGG